MFIKNLRKLALLITDNFASSAAYRSFIMKVFSDALANDCNGKLSNSDD